MAINGTFSIFRFTSGGETETTITDKIEFNGDAATPDARSFIQNVKPILSLIGQENETPDSNNPSNLDETGLAFVGLEIRGYFKGNESTRPLAMREFRDWLKEGDQKTATYPHGRFGFRNNIDNEYDLAPSATSGYLLEYFDTDQDYTTKRYEFLIKLRFQHTITDLNSV